MKIETSFLVNQPIAHRGLWNSEFPENSLGAFQNAINHNTAIELDVVMLDDGTLAVFHDDTLARMCNADGYIRRAKKEDLKKLKLAGTNYSIPTFGEVLKLVKGQVPLLIEVKNSSTKVGDLEEKVYGMLKTYKGEFAIFSFNPFTVKWFKDHAPEVIRGQLSSFFDIDDPTVERVTGIRKYVLKRMLLNKQSCPHFIAYDINNLPNRFVKKYKELPLLASVIDSEEKYYKAKECGANSIFHGFDITKVYEN